MFNLIVAFITGLTTGGLSCLAVQGGLLASSLGQQIEQDLAAGKSGGAAGKAGGNEKQKARIAEPILWFLSAKVFAYTLLGFLLGALGSVFQLTPAMRAVLQILIGIFMLGTALRMLNVHPIFRYFIIEPPSFITRAIRRRAKTGGSSSFSSLFLGLMTVFIPCGITQAMMAVAIATSNPWMGAATMFAFTLGTSPVFFIVSYLATRLSATVESYFTRIIAVVVLVLGIFTINTGLNLMGSPLSLTNLGSSIAGFFNPAPAQAASLAETQPAEGTASNGSGGCGMKRTGSNGDQDALTNPTPLGPNPESTSPIVDADLVINVKNNGYQPNTLHAKAGTALKLKLVSKGITSCSLAFVIPSLNYEILLQQTGEVVVDIPAQKSGTVMRFSCSMGMYTGKIIFDQ